MRLRMGSPWQCVWEKSAFHVSRWMPALGQAQALISPAKHELEEQVDWNAEHGTPILGKQIPLSLEPTYVCILAQIEVASSPPFSPAPPPNYLCHHLFDSHLWQLRMLSTASRTGV